MEPTSYPDLPEGIINLAVDGEGDVIFHAKRPHPDAIFRARYPSWHPSVKMLVSSKELSRHSSVFRAMFGGQWAESQQVSLESPGTCTFTDNGIHAFFYLCVLMHRPDCLYPIPDSVNYRIRGEFTKICDKYNCLSIGREQARIWVNDRLAGRGSDDDSLIVATYMFDLWEEFHRTTLCLILDAQYGRGWHTLRQFYKQHSAFAPMPSDIRDYIIESIIDEWGSLLRKCERATMKTVADVGRPDTKKKKQCKGQLRMSAHLVQWLDKHHLWNDVHKGLRRWRRYILKLKDESWWRLACFKPCSTCKSSKEAILKLEGEIMGILDGASGLCLDYTMGNETCRQHPGWDLNEHEIHYNTTGKWGVF